MNQTQNPNQQNFNQNKQWNLQNQGMNQNSNQMQAMLMKQFYLNQQNNKGNNTNIPNNMFTQLQGNNISSNSNINANSNYQQMLLNNKQQMMNMNNQKSKININQQNNPMQIPNMLNFNMLNNANLQTAQKEQLLNKFQTNNFSMNNFLNKPNIPKQNNIIPQQNTNKNNFPLNNNQNNMSFNPELLNNLALMNQNIPNNLPFNPNMPNNPNQPFMQNSNIPLQNYSLNNQINPNNNEMQNTGSGNMDMLKLIQDAISNLKNKGNVESQAEKIHGGTNNGESDISYGGASLKNEFESQYSLEDENLKQLWSGFLTKNKKDKVCVDAYQIRHECSHFFTSEFNLNVSHRTQFEEIMKRPIIGVIAFSPQNETQIENFQEYINYFKEKDRAGVVNFKSQATMYIVPPGDFSRKFYQNPKKHLLGIFVDASVDIEKYVDMNQLKLPPPVISSAEKKLLLKEQRNKQLGISSANAGLNVSSNQQNLNNTNLNAGNQQGFGGNNTLDAFNNLNAALLNKPNTDYDELIKNMTNEEKGKY